MQYILKNEHLFFYGPVTQNESSAAQNSGKVRLPSTEKRKELFQDYVSVPVLTTVMTWQSVLCTVSQFWLGSSSSHL